MNAAYIRALRQGRRLKPALDRATSVRLAHIAAQENAPLSPWLLGTALAAGFGAYIWGTKNVITHDRDPLKAEIYKPCTIPKTLTAMDPRGRTINVASALYGKTALMQFGSIHSSDTLPQFSKTCQAAEIASKSLGDHVTPVFYSIDADHDKPAELFQLAKSSGMGTALVLAGSAEDMLEVADRFKNCESSKEVSAEKSQEKYKRGIELDTATGYATDHVFGINAEGRFVAVMPKGSGMQDMAEKLVKSVKEQVGA